jgi:hypothetical protein
MGGKTLDIGVVGIDKIRPLQMRTYFVETTTPIGGIIWT